MAQISPCLLFYNQAEEAAQFYTSVFRNSKIDQVSYYGDEGPGPKGSVLTVTFHVNGTEIMALNGGPHINFTPALSLVVYCEEQPEIDYYWERLSEGGSKGVCGWLTDKYGVSWQIVPTMMSRLLTDKDISRTDKVMRVMLKMTKLDIAQLKEAYDQG